ncbi:MAG: iron-sulfur cluster-binding domain-containing protein [Chitinophagaceae bacterium]
MQQIKVRIYKIVDETHDTRSFYIEQLDGTPIPYSAGQFVTLLFNINGHEVRRSYSLGSSPGYEKDVFITVKRKENGEISRKLLDAYQTGDILACLLPSGRFVREAQWGTDLYYFFFAAGSGIVPVFGIVKSLLHENPKARIFLFNQTVSDRNVIYKKQLEALAARYENLEYVLYMSAPTDTETPVRRLNNLQVERIVNQRLPHTSLRDNARFYLCGPMTFMRMVRFTLKLDGFADEQIKQEMFIIQENRRLPPLLKDTTPKHVKVLAEEGIFEFEVQYPESILAAGKKAHIALPFSCGAGQCSTCTVKCVSGEVLMSHNDILTQKDLDNGLVLTCTGHPVTDVVLDYK